MGTLYNLYPIIRESTDQIATLIHQDVARELNKKWSKLVDPLRRETITILGNFIRSQREWDSIISGDLRKHFGLVDGSRRLEGVLDIWLRGITITFKEMRRFSRGFSGGITITGFTTNYADVLTSSFANFTTKKGDLLEWLNWLLIQGDRVIIKRYDVAFGRGRAGNLIMKEDQSSSWSVPSEFSGTSSSNFLTRAIQQSEQRLLKNLMRIIINGS